MLATYLGLLTLAQHALASSLDPACAYSTLAQAVPTSAATTNVTFQSARNLNWRQMMQGGGVVGLVNVPGKLIEPAKGQIPYPTVVLLHGSGGMRTDRMQYVQNLLDHGVAIFVFDAFCARGIGSVVGQQGAVHIATTVGDTFNALKALAETGKVNMERLGLIGFSRGGLVATLVADEKVVRRFSRQRFRFKTAVGVYPGCSISLKSKQSAGTRLLFQLGVHDDYQPPQPCRNLFSSMKEAGFDVKVTEYLARHAWDSSVPLTRIANETGFGNCAFSVDAQGIASDTSDNKKMLTQADVAFSMKKCGVSGVTIEGNPKVTEASRAEAIAFLLEGL
jgi:dienelactone hydrolase